MSNMPCAGCGNPIGNATIVCGGAFPDARICHSCFRNPTQEELEAMILARRPAQTWGVWCIPIHEKTKRWPKHWWGQHWSTTDRVPLGEPRPYDEAGARAEAAKQTRIDVDRAYRYEARPLPARSPQPPPEAPSGKGE